MKTRFILFFFSIIILLACNKDDSNQLVTKINDIELKLDTCTITTKLIANGPNYDSLCIGFHMGTVTVVDDSNFVSVTYDVISEGWVLKATQLFIGLEPDIPANKPGDPILGQFPFNHIHDSAVTSFTVGPVYFPDGDYVVAAHADAEKTISIYTVDSMCWLLPEIVDFSCSGIGPDCYLNINVLNGEWLDGTY